jgi:hypothetical protein
MSNADELQLVRNSPSRPLSWSARNRAERNSAIVALRKAGMPPKRIAAQFRVCTHTVYNVLSDYEMESSRESKREGN